MTHCVIEAVNLYYICTFKGTASRDIYPIFHDSKVIFLIHMLKNFRIRSRIHGNIRVFKKFEFPIRISPRNRGHIRTYLSMSMRGPDKAS